MFKAKYIALKFFLFLLISLGVGAAPDARLARAAQWDAYALPTGEFTRYMDKKQGFSFWRPADWIGAAGGDDRISFSSKAGQQNVLFISESLPEGYGVANYTTSLLQHLRKAPLNLDSLVVRQVLLGGVEGREISYEMNSASGTLYQTYWVAQVGALAYNFILTAAPEDQSRLEPYFKRMMLSVRFNAAGHWDEEFETFRAQLTTSTNSQHDAEGALLSEALRAAKEPTPNILKRLQDLTHKAPEIVLDMLTDYDPNVRAAAITALGQAAKGQFTNALLWALKDGDNFCRISAAKMLAAGDSTVIKNNLPRLAETNGAILQLAAWLSDEKARELAEELLSSEDSTWQLAGMELAIMFPLKGLRLPYHKLFSTGSVGLISYAMEAVRLRRPTEDVPELLKMIGTDAELWAIHALGELAAPSIEPQLDERRKTLSTRYNKLLSSKGIMTIRASDSSTPPPPPPPMPMPKQTGTKKKAGKNPPQELPGQVGKGIPGGVPVGFPSASSSSPASTPPAVFKAEPELTRLICTINELEAASAKIKLREKWAAAKDSAARRVILNEASKTEGLQQWAKATLKEPEAEMPVAGFDVAGLTNAPTSGETLFPNNATLYLKAPNFEQTLETLEGALSGIQMNTVRDQMTFALMLNSMKAQLAQKMNLGVTGSASQTLGIDLKAPISMASWPDKGTNSSLAHSAVLLRVTDRNRFERTLTLYQTDLGGFDSFVPVVSLGTRLASITPAVMPIAFYAINAISNFANTINKSDASAKGDAALVFADRDIVYAREEKIGALPVKVFEKLGSVGIDATKQERIYLAYLGDTAVLAPSREALLEVLNTNKPAITSNKSYDRIKAESGEIVFFSQLDELLNNLYQQFIGDGIKTDEEVVDTLVKDALTKAFGTETGNVRLSNSAWDSIFHLAIGDNDLVKTVRPFKATELSAPRDLLPQKTLFYAATVIDPERFVAYGKKWEAELAKASKAAGKGPEKKSGEDSFSKIFAGMQTLLTPHLQGEVSIALVSIANLLDSKSSLPSMVVALKLKNNTLAQIARSGLASLMLKRVPGVTALKAPVFKLEDKGDSFHAVITDDYFILADSLETLTLLEGKEKFATARDFTGTVGIAPEKLAFFSTLSVEAALSDVQQMLGKNEKTESSTNEFIESMMAWARAFHSYRMLISYVDDKTLEGLLGVSFDQAGRYNVGAMKRGEFDLENALIAPKGVSILQPKRVESLQLKVSAKQPGVLARVQEDLNKFGWHKVEAKATESSLAFTVSERRIPDKLTIKLPVTGAALAPYLKASSRIDSDSPQIIAKAKEIVGKEKDGRKVARLIGEWTYENLKWKKVSSTTVETLAAREADCLEHSELYVAMARSLGLPARVVGGAAYSGGSFGAHAWVEVYLGKWVEIDPTWGMMDYVDATHVRFEGNDFISYAQLNQVELEVVEAHNFTAAYQRDPVRLVKEFMSVDSEEALGMVFDLRLTAEQTLGAGGLSGLDDKQRATVINAFDRALAAISEEWQEADDDEAVILSSEVRNNQARVLAIVDYSLIQFTLAARDGVWYITERENLDTGEKTFTENIKGALNPAVNLASIRQQIYANTDQALKQLEQLIVAQGESAPLLMLKADLLRAQSDKLENEAANKTEPTKEPSAPAAKKTDEATRLMESIATRWPDYAPAHYVLAASYQLAEESEKAVAAYQRYAKLMTLDPRPWSAIASLNEKLERPDAAENAYREALARNREGIDYHTDLIAFQLRQGQPDKAKADLAMTLKQIANANDVFRYLDWQILHGEEETTPEMAQEFEELLLSFPLELGKSVDGLRGVSEAQRTQQKYDAAIKTLQRVIKLNPEGEDQVTIASIYREARRFSQALLVADQAVKLDQENSEAHYERACALAQLGRKREALAALKKAHELNDNIMYRLADEEDLKPLADSPEIKALIEKAREASK